MPAKKLILNIGGDNLHTSSASAKYTTLNDPWGLVHIVNGVAQCSYNADCPEVTGDHVGVATWGSSGEIMNKGLFPIGYGIVEKDGASCHLSDTWIMRWDKNWSNESVIISVKTFANIPVRNGYALLHVGISTGKSIKELSAGQWKNNKTLNYAVYAGGQLVQNGTGIMTLSKATGTALSNLSDPAAHNYENWDGLLINVGSSPKLPIEVRIYKTKDDIVQDGHYIKFDDISWRDPGILSATAQRERDISSHIEITPDSAGIGGYEEKTLSVGLQNYRRCRNGSSFMPQGDWPSYQYLFRPINIVCHRTHAIGASHPEHEYTQKYNYWSFGWKCRILAHSFCFIDDEHIITIANSKIL